MSIESDADRLAIIKSCGGETVTLFSAPYETTVWAIMDREYIEINGVECEKPAAMLRTSDIENADTNYTVVHGSSLATSTATYTVIGIKPDGTGMTILVLQDQ